MTIRLESTALDAAARGYEHAASSLQQARSGLSAAIDQVAAGAANPQVSAGARHYHGAMTGVLQALAERTGQHGAKVRAAAADYLRTDQSIESAAAATPTGPAG
jgi:hypothetical protein